MAATALVGLLLGLAGTTRAASDASPTLWSPWVSASRTGPVATQLNHDLVVLGDSVPAGTGCGCPPFGSLLARDLGGHVALHVHAADGRTASQLAIELSAASGGLAEDLRNADLVTVTIGANDFDPKQAVGRDCADATCFSAALDRLRTTMPTVLQRVRAMVRPSARVLVTGYWNVFLDGAVGRERGAAYVQTSDALTRQVNLILAAAAAATGARYVDLYAAFKADADGDDTALLAADGDHPSASGHQLIASLLARAVGS